MKAILFLQVGIGNEAHWVKFYQWGESIRLKVSAECTFRGKHVDCTAERRPIQSASSSGDIYGSGIFQA